MTVYTRVIKAPPMRYVEDHAATVSPDLVELWTPARIMSVEPLVIIVEPSGRGLPFGRFQVEPMNCDWAVPRDARVLGIRYQGDPDWITGG